MLKLSKLTVACTVWRGFTGASLPKCFFEANADGVKGGIEYGFSSTTVDRAQALHYAQGKASTVFEMEMGMVMNLSFFSHCPTHHPPPSTTHHPPLSSIALHTTRLHLQQ